jgi:DNA-binding response OmpR family regulator
MPDKKRVLVIEDEEPFAKLYGLKLAQDGIESVLAFDGDEGLGKLLAEHFDLVLLDLMLPKHDGFWLLEERKKYKGIATVPIVVLSNLGQADDIKRAKELGAVDYIVKSDSSIQQIIDMAKKQLALSEPQK